MHFKSFYVRLWLQILTISPHKCQFSGAILSHAKSRKTKIQIFYTWLSAGFGSNGNDQFKLCFLFHDVFVYIAVLFVGRWAIVYIFCLINGHALCVIQIYFIVVNLLRYNKTQFHKFVERFWVFFMCVARRDSQNSDDDMEFFDEFCWWQHSHESHQLWAPPQFQVCLLFLIDSRELNDEIKCHTYLSI